MVLRRVDYNKMLQIQYKKTNENAIIPTRAYHTDIGMDLVAIKKHKVLDSGVILYDTGLSISPPQGYYIEIVPRSSISKSGWILANNIGVIDPSYTGNLYIALAKISDNAKELEPPFCLTQIILRKAEYGEMSEIKDLSLSERGSGGFGSTGERTL